MIPIFVFLFSEHTYLPFICGAVWQAQVEERREDEAEAGDAGGSDEVDNDTKEWDGEPDGEQAADHERTEDDSLPSKH